MSAGIRKTVFAALLFFTAAAGGSSAKAQTVPLPATWKFAMGDSAVWASPAFNDSLWGTKNTGASWKAAGMKADVYAWYRTKIVIPSAMKDAIEKGNGLRLSLGKIDDVDQTFFNGELIGQTGSLPPKYETKWDEPRTYRVSPQAIRYDEENVIAVRVFSPDIGGVGMYAGPYTYGPLQWSDYVSITDSIIGGKNSPLTAVIKFTNKRNIVYAGTMEYRITDRSNKELFSEIRDFRIQPDSGTGNIFSSTHDLPAHDDFVKIIYRFTEAETKGIYAKEQFYLTNKQIRIPVAREPKPVVKNKISDAYASIPFKDQHLTGYLGKRLVQNLGERLLKVDEPGIIGS